MCNLGKEQFFKGIDASYYSEGYYEVRTEEIYISLQEQLNKQVTVGLQKALEKRFQF